MKIVIAHSFPVRRARLVSRLTKCAEVEVVDSVGDLTPLYTAAEHQVPDLVLVSADLAEAPEFEIMLALFAALRIACILLVDEGPPPASPLITGLPRMSSEIPVEAILDRMRAVAGTRTGRVTQVRPAAGRPEAPRQVSGADRLILIGSSTGGVDALICVLDNFTTTSPPTLIVQHTGGRFASSLIRLLDGRTQARVVPALDGEVVRAGHVYLMPDDEHHLCLAPDRPARIRLNRAPPSGGHRPSVDVLFQSAVPLAAQVSAAILTGMGRDGAAGLLALRDKGATTMVQDEETSIVWGMPRVAWEIGAAARKLPLARIGPALLSTAPATAAAR